MGRKPRVDRSPEEKWQIVQEGIKSGNVSETCRRHGIAPNLYYRWKDEAEQGAKAALGGRSAAAGQSRGESDAHDGQRYAVHFVAFFGDARAAGITHRRTAYHHPEGNSYIERFHRSLKEEEVWTA